MSGPVGNGDVAIEVHELEKTFRIPTRRISRLKERLVRPLARQEYRELQALNRVSFDIARGEFFGILGRNGSGKSTLLKIMASIYAADGGRVRMAGSVAPFIQLSVCFDMKLKNYSSGMLVRLAFSVMIQAQTDILLIDEVLAVGDAAFQQKCSDVFHSMREQGKTIVLVTHDVAAVERFCHRAMLLRDGEIVQIGDPEEVSRGYLKVNFEAQSEAAEVDGTGSAETSDVRLLDAWIEDAGGQRTTNVEQGSRTTFHVLLETMRRIPGPQFGLIVGNADGVNVHEFLTTSAGIPQPEQLEEGERVTVTVSMENRLSPGRYYLHLGVSRHRNERDVVLFAPHLLRFVVYGDGRTTAIVEPDHRMEMTTEDAENGGSR